MIVQPNLAENLLIVVGEGAWVFSATAQLHKLVKTRNTRGLSAPSLTLNGAGNIAWCTYFALNHLWFPFVTNFILIFLTIAILGFTLANRKQFVRGLITIAVVGPLTSYLLLVMPAGAGWVGMSYNWVANTPWLLRVVRRKKVSGISEKSLFFSIGAIIFTFTYGALIHALPLVVGGVQGLSYDCTILAYYYKHRHNG